MERTRLWSGLILLGGIAGCARPSPVPVAQTTAATPAHVSTGTILSLREIVVPNSKESWRNVLLAGNPVQPLSESKMQPLMEFIVRTDGGATLSIVQANNARLHTGDRVVILRGDQTQLAPSNANALD